MFYLMLFFLSEIGLGSRPADYNCPAFLKCDLRSYSHTLSSLVLSVVDYVASDYWSDFVRPPIAIPRTGLLKDSNINLYYFFSSHITLPKWLKTFELESTGYDDKKKG